jgi:hypothetical protein
MSAARSPLVTAVLATHLALALSVAALAFRTAASPLAGAALGLIVAAPLVATLRGLGAPSRARAGAAVLLVAYVGVTSVEVVATLGAAKLASLALLLAVLDLAILLVLIRRSQPLPRATRE